MNIKLLTEHHLEFLSLKGGYIGLSESTLVKMPHCWKSHVAAHLCFVCLLQSIGLLDGDNNLREIQLFRMLHEREILDDFKPDFIIYADASRVGLGAYLLTNEDDTIRWISDQWKENMFFNPTLNSNASEFYAIVTACYTWKYKFRNKKVLCFSDSMNAVNLVNNGVLLNKVSKLGHQLRFIKLYTVLTETCRLNNITLLAKHVYRTDNVAADLLSRNRVSKFHEIVPTAKPVPKKSKKLDFCTPKVELLKYADDLAHKSSEASKTGKGDLNSPIKNELIKRENNQVLNLDRKNPLPGKTVYKILEEFLNKDKDKKKWDRINLIYP